MRTDCVDRVSSQRCSRAAGEPSRPNWRDFSAGGTKRPVSLHPAAVANWHPEPSEPTVELAERHSRQFQQMLQRQAGAPGSSQRAGGAQILDVPPVDSTGKRA